MPVLCFLLSFVCGLRLALLAALAVRDSIHSHMVVQPDQILLLRAG